MGKKMLAFLLSFMIFMGMGMEALASPEQNWEAIYGALSRHDTSVTFHSDSAIEWDSIAKLAMSDDGRNGTYYWLEMFQYDSGFYTQFSPSNYEHTLKFNYPYGLEQSKRFEHKLKSVVTKLCSDAESDLEKVEAINDYIIDHVEYDYDTLNGEDRYGYTAYGALINGKAVCQGYAILFYRMGKEAGLDVKYVSGMAGERGERGLHAWNIVKVGRRYYNIDVCWNDPGDYDFYDGNEYFLLNNRDFKMHQRNPEYNTAEFNGTYRMGKHSIGY